MKIIFEDVTPRQLADAFDLANADQKLTVRVYSNAEGHLFSSVGGRIRVEDEKFSGWDVGRVSLQHDMFTRYRVELDNGRERDMIARLAFALADQR